MVPDAGGEGRERTGEGMLHYGHPRMPLSERAKIFMPFDPLKGFREELRRREVLVEQSHEHDPWLPEDDLPEEDPSDPYRATDPCQ